MRFLSLERSQHPVILPNAAPWVPFIGSLPLPRYRRLYSFIGEIVSRSLGAIQLCYLLHGSPITKILVLQLYLHGSPLGAIRLCYLLHESPITKILVLQLYLNGGHTFIALSAPINTTQYAFGSFCVLALMPLRGSEFAV